MDETWLTAILSSYWAPPVVGFLLGVFFGWVVWGAALFNGNDEATGADGEAGAAKVEGPGAAKLKAIEDELAKAKSLLETDERDNADATEILSELDEAVKRANGRLKLILKSIKRVKKGD